MMNSKKHTISMFAPFVSVEAREKVMKVLETPMIGQGKTVDEFESAIGLELGIKHVVAVYNSAAAIRLALSICGVKPGDEVITTPMTCTLTNHPILEQFAKTVFADIQKYSGNIDPKDVEKRITRNTKAIVCTHWGGTPCDIDELNVLGNKYNIPVIEDASESFGSSYHGKPIGSHSRFIAFSFHAIQIITASEGGALAVQNDRDDETARKQRWYGIDRIKRIPNILGYYDFDVTTTGYGYYMTNVAAAIGIENLKTLKAQQEHRKAISDMYWIGLTNSTGIELLSHDNDRVSSNHFFTVLVENRNDFCKKMTEAGINVSIVHARNDFYSVFGGLRRNLPNLDWFSERYICLPCHMNMSIDDADYIVWTIRSGW